MIDDEIAKAREALSRYHDDWTGDQFLEGVLGAALGKPITADSREEWKRGWRQFHAMGGEIAIDIDSDESDI